jgi:hypothetical protein
MVFHWFAPKYKLIAEEHLVHDVLGMDYIHDGLFSVNKVRDQVFMIFRAFMHREAHLHNAQVMSGLDLSDGQGNGGTTTHAMESNLPSMDRDVLQAVH